jgi:hypothetical protein
MNFLRNAQPMAALAVPAPDDSVEPRLPTQFKGTNQSAGVSISVFAPEHRSGE